MYRLPWTRILLLTAVGCSIWNGLLMWVGYLLGANWRRIDNIMRQYSRILLAVFIVAGVIWLVRKRLSATRNQ
jgi:membrane protein DedA with SNARE-associated domain